MREHGKFSRIIIWIIVFLISGAVIIAGSRATTKNLSFSNKENATVQGVVTSVNEVNESEKKSNGQSLDNSNEDVTIKFECVITSGKHKNEFVNATQVKGTNTKIVEKGDKILLVNNGKWNFADYYRLDTIIFLALIFAAGLILIGLKKGINALISLTFTALFVFCVFLPWIMSGYNIYLGIFITCFFTIVMTLLLLEGITKKAFVTMLGCFAGTGTAALVTFIANRFLNLTGMTDEHSVYITMLSSNRPIDLVGLIFAGIIVGALGAIMDVAMDISSSLNEIVTHVPDIKFANLFKSGMRIGRDIMGTMSNTLILAYIGSSLTNLLLLVTYASSLMDLVNKEILIVDMLQALAGSIAILLTVPFTVMLAGVIYLKKRKLDSKTKIETEC